MNYDDWKLETPEDERERLRGRWGKLPECLNCGTTEHLTECEGFYMDQFICEDCEEEERRALMESQEDD